MPDVFTPAKRSAVMSLIRSTGNAATELRLVALLRAEGITGWRRHLSLTLPHARLRSSPSPAPRRVPAAQQGADSAPRKGHPQSQARAQDKAAAKASPATAKRPRQPRVRPDFVFRQQRLVIFVDGCFWHACPRHGTRPKQNRKFWDEKIARNRTRDRHVTRALRHQGWTVLRLWECALAKKRVARTVARLRRALKSVERGL